MKNNKYGKVFWITGLSGSGKSTVGNYLLPKIKKKYGETILINGDDIRDIYGFKNYDRSSRLKLSKSNFDLCFFLMRQGYNIIFTTVSLMHETQKYNRKVGKRHYVEIFLEADIEMLKKKKSKFFYKKKVKNVVGLTIKPQFPKKPDIRIKNSFDLDAMVLTNELFNKIIKFLNNHTK